MSAAATSSSSSSSSAPSSLQSRPNKKLELLIQLRTMINSNDVSGFCDILRSNDRETIATVTDDDGRNFLHWIAAKGLVEFITAALHLEYNPDPLDEDDWTPLHVAAANGRDQAVTALLKGGCQIDRLTGSGRNSALHIAAGKGLAAVCEAILRFTRDGNRSDLLTHVIEQCNGQWLTPMQRAVCADQIRTAQVLISYGGNLDIRVRNTGETLLHIASGNKSPEMVRLLIESRPSLINVSDQRGYKPYYCHDNSVVDVYREYLDLIDEDELEKIGRH